jgi:O-methyltransferase
LAPFLSRFKPRSRLVIHNDSDLYSSSLYLLTQLDPFAVAGTVIIFDELYSALHEFRAMNDYLSAYRRKLVPVGRVDDVHGRVGFIFE